MRLSLRITILVLSLAWLGTGRVAALSEERAPPDGVILFKPGSAEITRDDTRTIDRLAALAKGDFANWVTLDSCTLNRHSSAMSLAISQQRIDEIEHRMVLKGIPAHRVLGVNTLSTCHGDAGRVEIRIEKLGHSK